VQGSGDATLRYPSEEGSFGGMAGLTERWSNRLVEGFVHKLNVVKRQRFGRAGVDLLKGRMFAA